MKFILECVFEINDQESSPNNSFYKDVDQLGKQ